MARKIPISKASIKILTGVVHYIGKYKPGAVTKDSLPIPVVLQCIETGSEHPAKLVSCIGMGDSLNEIFTYSAEGKSPAECCDELMQRHGVQSTTELGYYVYLVD